MRRIAVAPPGSPAWRTCRHAARRHRRHRRPGRRCSGQCLV